MSDSSKLVPSHYVKKLRASFRFLAICFSIFGRSNGLVRYLTRNRAPSPQAISWAIRLFLGREPHGLYEIAAHQGHADLESLRRAFAETPNFGLSSYHSAPGPFLCFYSNHLPTRPYHIYCVHPPLLNLRPSFVPKRNFGRNFTSSYARLSG